MDRHLSGGGQLVCPTAKQNQSTHLQPKADTARLPTLSSRTRAAKRRVIATLVLAASSLAQSGCGVTQKIPAGPHDTRVSYHDHSALQIEYPEVNRCANTSSAAASLSAAPHAMQDPASLPAVELSLPEAVQRALQSSPVLRSIGGAVVNAPQTASTVFEPSLSHASPQSGVEAALSAFDAQYTQQLFWQKTDLPTNFNAGALGGGGFAIFNPSVRQNTTGSFVNELSKRTATGAQFAIRNNITYTRTEDASAASQLFPSAFAGFLEAEYRQPLMRGRGVTFNRIAGAAGASGAIGQYNGVLIARVNEDVALADFEAAVISLVADVEQTYWDLTSAYRVLEATVKGREAALQTFQYQQVRLEVGTGRQDEEAQARSQYYQFQAQVQSALAGATGLYEIEQQLRYLIGMPASDGSLIKPTTNPIDAKVVFDWDSALGQALDRRVEVRRQKYNVKRRELELCAARLNRKPQIDFVGSYRWRGLGNHLIGPTDNGPFDNLADSITDGNYQEWRAGVEIASPIGLRAASNAVAHAKLSLSREQAVLNETELRISHDLADAARSIELSYQLVETNYNRYLADLRQVEVLRRRYRDGTDNINFLLQAQRQVVTSEIEFYRSISSYNVAIREFHRQKGSLLAYAQVGLAEDSWCPGAEADAYQLGRHLEPRPCPDKVCTPRPVSSGPFDPSAVQPSLGMSGPSSWGMLDADVVSPSDGNFSEQTNVPANREGLADPNEEEIPAAPASRDN